MADPSTNPYLALLQQEQQPPGWAQILQHIGNLGFGLAGGFGQAATTGQPTMAGIGPGLMLGNQLNAQAAHQAEQERMKRLELQFKAQEHEDKRAELLRNQAAIDAYVKAPGFQVSPTQGPLMGPNGTAQPSAAQPGPDLKTGGAPLVDYLTTKHGLSPLAASTVVGNLYQESGFNPAATGDSGSAFGMAQWRLDRQTGLRNFAATQNKPPTDPQVQLDYLVSEMKGGDMGAQRAYAGLQQAKTPQEANAAMMHFFRPAGYTPANPAGGHGFQNRVQYTQALLPNGQPAPQVAQGDAVVTQPRPGPTLSALPAFEGPGMGTIQPGALPEGVQPSVNMPAVTASGAPIDPNAQPPPFMQTGPGGPNVVQAQATPGPNTPPMAPTGGGPAPGGIAAPPIFVPPPMRDIPPEVNAQINRLVGLPRGVGLTIAQAEEKKHQLRMEQWKTDTEAAKAQHASALEVYKQQQEGGRHERGEKAKIEAEERTQARQLEAEQRRAGAEQQRYERDAAERQKAREDAAKASGDKQSLELTKAQRDQENKLRDDFNGLKPVQDFRKADLVFQSAQKAAKTDTKAADLNLVYAFATMMDPGSVVRDQETGMVVATQGATDRIKALVASLSGKSGLSPDAKEALIAEMGTRHSGYKEAHDAYATAAEEIATRQGLDHRNVVTRVVVKKPTEENPAAPPSGTFPAPPPAAIKALQMAPNQREDFDKMFGPGAAAKVLGR